MNCLIPNAARAVLDQPTKLNRGHTWSEEWRLACEARWLLRQTLEFRRGYLARIEQKRGKQSAENLKAILTKEHKRPTRY